MAPIAICFHWMLLTAIQPTTNSNSTQIEKCRIRNHNESVRNGVVWLQKSWITFCVNMSYRKYTVRQRGLRDKREFIYRYYFISEMNGFCCKQKKEGEKGTKGRLTVEERERERLRKVMSKCERKKQKHIAIIFIFNFNHNSIRILFHFLDFFLFAFSFH